MITIGEWLNPTRAIGLVAYGTAVACCGVAWLRDKREGNGRQVAGLLTLIESMLLLDMAFNWRWRLHQFLLETAQRAHEYQVRRLPQVIVLMVLAGLLVWGLLRVRRLSLGKRGLTLASSGALLSVILWCTEVVSLHQVDHVLYFSLGGVMAVSLLWITACTMTSIGILLIRMIPIPSLG